MLVLLLAASSSLLEIFYLANADLRLYRVFAVFRKRFSY